MSFSWKGPERRSQLMAGERKKVGREIEAIRMITGALASARKGGWPASTRLSLERALGG